MIEGHDRWFCFWQASRLDGVYLVFVSRVPVCEDFEPPAVNTHRIHCLVRRKDLIVKLTRDWEHAVFFFPLLKLSRCASSSRACQGLCSYHVPDAEGLQTVKGGWSVRCQRQRHDSFQRSRPEEPCASHTACRSACKALSHAQAVGSSASPSQVLKCRRYLCREPGL